MLTVKDHQYNIEADFGDKTVMFRKWSGKERFLLEEIQLTDTDKLAEILVFGCMQEFTLLTKAEILYSLYLLYSISFSTTPMNIEIHCLSCKEALEIELPKTSLLYGTKKADFTSPIIVDNIVINLLRPTYNDYSLELYSISKDINEKELLELLLSITSITINDDEVYDAFTFIELKDYLLGLDIDTFDNIIAQYNDKKFTFVPEADIICPNCDYVNPVLLDTLDNLYTDFLT